MHTHSAWMNLQASALCMAGTGVNVKCLGRARRSGRTGRKNHARKIEPPVTRSKHVERTGSRTEVELQNSADLITKG